MTFLKKAMDKDLDYWKKKLIGILNQAPMSKSIEDIFAPGDMLKSLGNKAKGLLDELLLKARGYPVGTIREWSGKKYKKLSSGKWMRTYSGTKERGEQQATRNVMSKIQRASSMEELSKIVSENMQRFKDDKGKTLPIVKDFMSAARGIEPGKKEPKEKVVVRKEMTDIKPAPKKAPGLQIINDKYQKQKNISGDTDDIYVGVDELTGTWKLVEADTPQASHNERTFNKTEGFPTNEDGSTINDRDYEKDKQAQEAVNKIASGFDGRALHFDSPVVVTEDGVVISGNNRTMSSKLAASKGTDTKYIEALNKRAKKFGFSAEDVAKFKNPRVVFEVPNNEAYSTKQFAKFNESSTKTMNPVEAAVKVSKTMTQDTVDKVSEVISDFDTMGELYSNKKAVNEIYDNLQKGGIINDFNRSQYVTDSGITGAGKEFLETVMIGSVVSEANIRGLSREGYKNIRKKLVRAITGLVQNKGMGGYAITDELNQAVDVMMQVTAQKDKFADVADFAKQGTMFEKKNPVAIELAKKLEMKEKDFSDFMNKMNANLSVGANGQADLFFGEVESKDDILSRMLDLRKSLETKIKKIIIRRR